MTQYYVVEYTYLADTTLQDIHRPAHLAYIQQRVEQGELVVSGPLAADEIPGGILIYRAADRRAVEKFVDEDPFVIHGVVQERRIHGWRPLTGDISSFPAVNG
ncbi:YciI family protein [Kribbella sp. NPDC056861]|uniref:YciI family protein n=1 Tax=Kribbella sp. NPDC056861 TaxID=3154857 RepID=UPI003435305B